MCVDKEMDNVQRQEDEVREVQDREALKSRSALLKKFVKDTKLRKIGWFDDSDAFSNNRFTANYLGLTLETEWLQDYQPSLRISREDAFSYDMMGTDLKPLFEAIKNQPHVLTMRKSLVNQDRLRESSNRSRARAKLLEKKILDILK